jgi:hypothetical protein
MVHYLRFGKLSLGRGLDRPLQEQSEAGEVVNTIVSLQFGKLAFCDFTSPINDT